jgi:hypothetical protein
MQIVLNGKRVVLIMDVMSPLRSSTSTATPKPFVRAAKVSILTLASFLSIVYCPPNRLVAEFDPYIKSPNSEKA